MTTPRFSDDPSQLELDCLAYLEGTGGEQLDLQTILLLREARASTELDRDQTHALDEEPS